MLFGTYPNLPHYRVNKVDCANHAGRVNYGCLLHVPAPARYVIPLALQSLPAILLVVGMSLSPESPRWLAKEDNWEAATSTLARLRNLPPTDAYVQAEIQEMADQLEIERRLTGGSSPKALFREMFSIPGNRNRALISIMLMICQQLTGVNAIVSTRSPRATSKSRLY